MSGIIGGIAELLFGSPRPDAIATNTVNIIANQATNIVQNATQTCDANNQILQAVNLSGCDMSGVTVNMSANTHYSIDCYADINLDTTVSQDMQLQVLQDAQATAMGLGLVAAEANNIVNQSLGMSTSIVSTVAQRMQTNNNSVQLVNCNDSSVNTSFFNFYAEIGSDAKSVLNAKSVVVAGNTLASTVRQTATATSKDLFGQLAELGGLWITAVAIVLVALIGGAAYVGGKTVSSSVASFGTIFTSPYIWLAIPTAFLVINSIMFFRNLPYYKQVVPNQQGNTDDEMSKATKRENLNLFLATTIPTAALVTILGIYVVWSTIRGLSGKGGSPGGLPPPPPSSTGFSTSAFSTGGIQGF